MKPPVVDTDTGARQGTDMKPLREHKGWQGLAIGVLLAVSAHAPASANTITVTSIDSAGRGTLAQALQDAIAGDTIDFNLGYPARISIFREFFTRSVTIAGPGSDKLTLDGEFAEYPIFYVTNSATITLSNLKLQGGGDSAIYVQQGTLTVNHCDFVNNLAGSGGAIINSGALTVNGSTFTGNHADNRGGAIRNNGQATIGTSRFTGNTAMVDGGAIYNGASMVVNASTFSGNQSIQNNNNTGGAISNYGTSLTINTSTFAGNTSSSIGGAIFTQGTGPTTLVGSTLSGNHAPNGGNGIYSFGGLGVSRSILHDSCGGTLASTGDNIDSDGTCITASTPSNDRTSLDPLLIALADNGGPTQTMALQLGSPAIDQVIVNAATCSGTDQRGFVRPLGARCDIGAIEMDLDKLFRNGFENGVRFISPRI